MARSIGIPKTGGRQVGTPNKRTRVLEETLERLGSDVPERILDLLPQLTPDRQVDVLLGLMPYLYPKRRMVEVAGDPSYCSRCQDRPDLEGLSVEELREMTIAFAADMYGKLEVEGEPTPSFADALKVRVDNDCETAPLSTDEETIPVSPS